MLFSVFGVPSVVAKRTFQFLAVVSLAVALPSSCIKDGSLAAAEPKPTAMQPAPVSSANKEASKKLLADFRQSYALPDDKVVRHLAPPFSPGRLEFYRKHHAEQAKSAPEGPEYMWFWWDRRPNPLPLNWPSYLEGRLSSGGMGWVGGKGVEVVRLVESFTRIMSHEIEGDRKLKWTRIAGDWVVRDGVPAEKMLQGLEAVLREECKAPIRFRLAEKDRQIIVVSGKYNYRPMPGRSTVTEDHRSGYEGNDLQDYDQLEIFARDRNGLTEEQSGDLAHLLSFLTWYLDRPVIGAGIRLPANMESSKPSERDHLLEWRSGNWRLRDEALEKGTLDEAAILKHLSEQTGLTFGEKTRRMRVLDIERAE